jgi:hypothetical protein
MKNAICYFFSFLVEAIILWQYSSNLFSAKRKLLVKLIALCCLYFILFFCSLFESIWLNVACYFLLNFIFLVIQFYLNWYTALFHSSILTAVMSMSELIVYGIIKRFAPHFLDNGREFNHLLVFTVFNKLIFFDDFRSFASFLSILHNFTDIFSAVSEYFSHEPLKLCKIDRIDAKDRKSSKNLRIDKKREFR